MGAYVYEKQLKRHTLSELVPVESFDEETHLFTMADGAIGFGFVAKPLPGGDESVTQRLNVLFSFDYPKESFIQIMLMGSQDIRPTLDKIKHIRNTKDEALKESLNNRLKMLTEGSNQAISLHAQSYVREYKVVFTIKLPLEQKKQLPKQHEISAARDLRLSFEQTLKSAGFVPQTMDAELYLRVVGQLLHWGPSANWRSPAPYYDNTTPVNEQLSEYDDMMQTDANGVWLGNKRLRILSPGRLLGQMSLHSMRRMIGDPLTGARGIHGNFFINLNIFIPDNVIEKQKAEKERNSVNYQAFGPMLKFNPKLLFKKESTDLLFKSINDGDRILKINLCIGLFTDSLDKSEARLTEAQTYFSEIGWSMKEDRYITLPMLVNSLPLCADPKAVRFLQRYKRCGSKHAVEFLPIISDWSGTGTPQLTFISRGGQIMNMDMFDSNTNYNTCIVAASGSGKSFLTNDIITSYISSGAKCWVIDIGRSYEKLAHAIGGDFVEFGEKSQICLNPFQIIKNYNEEADMLVGIVMSMAAMEDKLSDLQHARLRSILKELWDEHEAGMTVDRVAEKLLQDEDRRVVDMGHQLFAFTSTGEYGRFFNGENNVNFNNALTCLELEELKGRGHLQQVVLLILIYQIQQAMYLGNRDQRKILIIDEAWDLLAKGNIAKFIETGYRRFRKYNGAAITITQSLNDLYGSPSGVAIAENSANLYLLYQKPETIESIKRQNRLMIGDGGYTFLKSVHTVTGQYSEIFFVTSYGVGIGRLMVDKYTKLLYSTHPDDIKKISERTSRGMTTAEAIEDILVSDG
ncbi:type IV secretion system protein TraC [Methylophaga sp.]|uniref:type IV secretion system protein TraC n=1 Tax=Methylophaga sp. TaxID=2024840 RepID=UPI00271C2D94|nr:type IV secretion system protein TraC [Methylophaga sp.]MDO8827862.1 type IV secretion system protein TraC [Methylophaga sp.]